MLNPRSGLVRAGVRADFQLATVVVAAALFACIATSAALGADVEWDFRSPDLESGRETVTLSEPFTIATRFSFADVSLGDDSKWVAWLAGIATESDGIPEGVFIEWVGEKLLWSTTWKLRLVSSVGALMPSSSSGQRDSSTTVLSGNKPIAGHSYRAVMSYGSAEQELSVLVEDLTAGSVLYSGHFDVGNQAEHAPDEALLAGAGWARYGKGGETSGSSFVRFETVSLDLAYERLGLPYSMKQEFDSYLVRHQPGLPDSPAKVTGSVIWEDDLISIEMVWPKTRVEGSVEVTCVSGDREVELVTAEWSDKRQSHMLDLSGVPCGEMTIALRYVIGEERTLIVERGLTKRAVTAGVEGRTTAISSAPSGSVRRQKQ